LHASVATKEEKYDLEKEILLYLAKNRSGYYYEIYKHLCSRKKFPFHLIQIWRPLKKLKSKKMIKSRKIKKTRTKGQKKGPYYFLTTIGLLRLFTYEEEIPKYVDAVSEIHKNKVPLIFNQWEHFKQQKADGKVIQAIKSYYEFFVAIPVREVAKSRKTSLLKRRKLKDILTSGKLEVFDKWYRQKYLEILPKKVKNELPKYILFYHLPLLNLPPISQIISQVTDTAKRHTLEYVLKRCRTEMFEWIRVWYSEPSLRLFMNEHLNKYEERVTQWFTCIKELKEYIKTLETSKKSHN
jgi:hypothetical protein